MKRPTAGEGIKILIYANTRPAFRMGLENDDMDLESNTSYRLVFGL